MNQTKQMLISDKRFFEENILMDNHWVRDQSFMLMPDLDDEFYDDELLFDDDYESYDEVFFEEGSLLDDQAFERDTLLKRIFGSGSDERPDSLKVRDEWIG